MRQSTKEAIKSGLWIPVIVAVLTIGLSIVLSEVQNRVGWLPLLLGLGICLCIFFFAFSLILRKVCPISTDVVEHLSRRMDQFVDKGAVTWLLTNEALVDYERSVSVEEIWLVTSDLASDIPGSPFYDVVRQNLEKGIRYRYFIPRSLAAEARGRQLLENHRDRGDLAVITLSDEFFFLCPRLDFAIYDPMNRQGKRCGYMGLPVECVERIHGRMEPDLLDTLIGKLQGFAADPQRSMQSKPTAQNHAPIVGG